MRTGLCFAPRVPPAPRHLGGALSTSRTSLFSETMPQVTSSSFPPAYMLRVSCVEESSATYIFAIQMLLVFSP